MLFYNQKILQENLSRNPLEPSHYVVSLSKTLYLLLIVLVLPSKTSPGMTEKLLTGMERIKPNECETVWIQIR